MRRGLLLLVAVAAAACGVRREGPPRIPPKTVVLTFDDAVRNHLTFVAPLLERLGFSATFFVTAHWMADQEHYLSFEEVAELHRRGFEIGNHTWSHGGYHRPEAARHLADDTARVDYQLGFFGVPRPTSFAWPGDVFGPESLVELRRLGYRFARRGRSPKAPPAGNHSGPLYDPRRNDPLLVPSTLIVKAGSTLSDFAAAASRAIRGRAVIFQFHGVPDPANPDVSTDPEDFRRFMTYLKEHGYRGIALRDLEPYVDRTHLPRDPLARVRWPPEN